MLRLLGRWGRLVFCLINKTQSWLLPWASQLWEGLCSKINMKGTKDGDEKSERLEAWHMKPAKLSWVKKIVCQRPWDSNGDWGQKRLVVFVRDGLEILYPHYSLSETLCKCAAGQQHVWPIIKLGPRRVLRRVSNGLYMFFFFLYIEPSNSTGASVKAWNHVLMHQFFWELHNMFSILTAFWH